jgi:histidine triad (HIT) family protein
MSTIFSKIIANEIPCYKVAETKDFIAFLDVRPLAAGHTLVVPKVEVDYLFDIEDEQYLALQLFAKTVAVAIKKAIPCKRIGVAVIGLEVPHAHIHLVPLKELGDLNFEKERKVFSPDEYQEICKKIQQFI